jgi:hypothetical protein
MVSIVAARARYLSLYPDVSVDQLVIYATTQTHSLGLKSGLILGLPVHTISVYAEDNYSLRGQDLRETIEWDKANGKHPFVISETHPSMLDLSRFKFIPQSALSEAHQAAQLTISMKLARPVSPDSVELLVHDLTELTLSQYAIIQIYGFT